ncbi:hypothetical protein AAC387_Pa02g1813 [Persea americana]
MGQWSDEQLDKLDNRGRVKSSSHLSFTRALSGRAQTREAPLTLVDIVKRLPLKPTSERPAAIITGVNSLIGVDLEDLKLSLSSGEAMALNSPKVHQRSWVEVESMR